MLQQFRVGQIPVLENRRLIGIVEVETVLKWMDLRRSLGMDRIAGGECRQWCGGRGTFPYPLTPDWSTPRR